MVERHLWTKNPHAFGNVVERRLWTKNPQQIATFDFLNFMKNSNLGTSWSVVCGQKSTVIDVDFLSTNDAPQHSQKQIFGFHVDFLSTNDAPRYTRFVGFLSTIYR